MKDSLEFRAYEDGDFDQCLALFDSNCPKFFDHEEKQMFINYLKVERFPFFVISKKGSLRLVACGGYILDNDKSSIELSWGMVERGSHKNGIGRFLTEKRIKSAYETGMKVIKMDTSQHSLGFYQKMGFKVIGEVKNDYYGFGLDSYELEMQLY